MGAGPGVILLAATLQGNHPNNPPVGYYNILPSRVTLRVKFPGVSLSQDYDPPGPPSWVVTFPGHPVSV